MYQAARTDHQIVFSAIVFARFLAPTQTAVAHYPIVSS
jgi:hypothetical protein